MNNQRVYKFRPRVTDLGTRVVVRHEHTEDGTFVECITLDTPPPELTIAATNLHSDRAGVPGLSLHRSIEIR